MSNRVSTPPRQSLNARQLATVERLLTAGQALLEELGADEVTMRMVAARAGMSPATAYTFFANKDHLFAELFWRMIEADDATPLRGTTPSSRLQELVRHLAGLIASAPALAAAVNKSMLMGDPEVDRLRHDIGELWIRRFQSAIGPEVDTAVLVTLSFALTGALLQAGMGIFSYERLGDHLERTVAVIMQGA